MIGADAQSVLDVEDTRNRCQQALSDLPVADYRRSFTRTRPARPCRGPTSGTDCASRSSSPLSAVIPTYAFPTRSLARWGWWQFASGAWRDTEPGRVTAGTVEVVRFDEADVRGV